MKLFLAVFLWFVMAAFLATGVVLAVNGHFWLLGIGLTCFIVALTKVGILSH